MIPKRVKVVCFDRLLQVYDSKRLTGTTSLGAAQLGNGTSELEKTTESGELCRVTQGELYHNAKIKGKMSIVSVSANAPFHNAVIRYEACKCEADS